MNKQEQRIIIGGIAITTLASAGFAMRQGNMASADDNYSSPKTIVEEKKDITTETTVTNEDNLKEVVSDEKKQQIEKTTKSNITQTQNIQREPDKITIQKPSKPVNSKPIAPKPEEKPEKKPTQKPITPKPEEKPDIIPKPEPTPDIGGENQDVVIPPSGGNTSDSSGEEASNEG